MIPTALLVVVIGLSMALPLAAQEGARTAVDGLDVGQQVRVQAPGMAIELGTVSEIDAQTLFVLEDGQEWLIDIRAIERLEVREHPMVSNVILFGAIGAVLALAAGKAKGLGCAEGPSGNACREASGVSVPLFGIGGAAVGALVGRSQWRWNVLFPR